MASIGKLKNEVVEPEEELEEELPSLLAPAIIVGAIITALNFLT